MQTHHPESRKPAFRWLGWKGKPCNRSAGFLDLNEPRKRVFGTDMTNLRLKKNKVDSLTEKKSNPKLNVPKYFKHCNEESNPDESKLEQHSKHKSKGFVYGPFTPASISGIHDSRSKNMKQVLDFGSLASTFSPKYHNEGTFYNFVNL